MKKVKVPHKKLQIPKQKQRHPKNDKYNERGTLRVLLGPKTAWVSHLHLFFLLGLASNGPKRPKSPFLGSVRVGPTHGLIALVRFAVGLDNFCPETDEIQQFSCTIFLPFLNLSTLSILKIINKSVIVHFHPDFDLYPNCFF